MQTLSDGWTVPHRQLLDSQAGTALTTPTNPQRHNHRESSHAAQIAQSQRGGHFPRFHIVLHYDRFASGGHFPRFHIVLHYERFASGINDLPRFHHCSAL